MADADIVLEFEIEPGRSPDLTNVARALLAWGDTLRAAAEAIDPEGELIVELVGVEPGSQRFRQILKRAERFAQNVESGGQEYPLLKKHALALAGLIGAGVVYGAITVEMTPDPRIPDDQMKVFEDISRTLHESVDLQRSSQSFYGILQEEPAIRGLEVFEGDSPTPSYSVPRSEFADRSGIWHSGQPDQIVREEQRTATWDVVLVKPVLVGKARRWTFARDGLEFSALMTDKGVLEALHDRSLAIPFAEGVLMKIEVTYKEQFDGKTWRPLPQTRRVTRVLYPLVPAPPTPLFPGPNGPKE